MKKGKETAYFFYIYILFVFLLNIFSLYIFLFQRNLYEEQLENMLFSIRNIIFTESNEMNFKSMKLDDLELFYKKTSKKIESVFMPFSGEILISFYLPKGVIAGPDKKFWLDILNESERKFIINGSDLNLRFIDHRSNTFNTCLYDSYKKNIDLIYYLKISYSSEEIYRYFQRIRTFLIFIFSLFLISIVLVFLIIKNMSVYIQKYMQIEQIIKNKRDEKKEKDINKELLEIINSLKTDSEYLTKKYSEKQKRIAQLDNYNKNILANIDIGVLVYDFDKKITFFNKRMENIFGISYQNIKEKDFEILKMIHNDFYYLCKDSYEMKIFNYQSEIEINGTEYIVKLNPFRQDNRISGIMVILNDISEISKLRRNLNLKEKLASLGEMAGSIAHEFRNSMSTVKGYLQLLKRKIETDSNIELLNFTLNEVDNMRDRISYFLKYTRINEVHIKKIELRDTIRKIMQSFKHNYKEIKFIEKIPQNSYINGDIGLLHQVFFNVLDNGIKSALESKSADKTIITEFEQNENHDILRVIDSGKGIKDTEKEKIFQPFYTTKSDGMGLGLAICYKIISLHKGEIDIFNRKDEKSGAVVEIRIPKTF